MLEILAGTELFRFLVVIYHNTKFYISANETALKLTRFIG